MSKRNLTQTRVALSCSKQERANRRKYYDSNKPSGDARRDYELSYEYNKGNKSPLAHGFVNYLKKGTNHKW